MTDDDTSPGYRVTFGDLILTPPQSIGFAIPLSREMALACGMVEPTPEEQAKREGDRADLERRRAAAAVLIPADLARLDAIADPVARLVLDHHGRHYAGYGNEWICDGCDAQGYEVDHTMWPCSTVDLIAKHYGIELTDMWLFERPTGGSLDQGEPA